LVSHGGRTLSFCAHAVDADHHGAICPTGACSASSPELTNESTLEGRLDGVSIIVATHEGNGLIGWHARQHCNACQSRPGPSAPSSASKLDPLMSGAGMGIHQRVDSLSPIAR
jgi:hypothetical protein